MAMLRLAMPQLNVLTKLDLMQRGARSEMDLDALASGEALELLCSGQWSSGMPSRYAKLPGAIATVVQEFDLVQFLRISVQDEQSLSTLLGACDAANGFVYSQSSKQEEGLESFPPTAGRVLVQQSMGLPQS